MSAGVFVVANSNYQPQNNNRWALGCALLSVILYSLFPLLFQMGNADVSPFLFGGMWRFGFFIGVALFLVVFYLRFIRSKIAMAIVGKGIFSMSFVLLFIGLFDYTAYAWASSFIDIAIVSIIYETWPIFFVFYFVWLKKRQIKTRESVEKIPASSYILMIFGLVGVFFAVMSKHGSFSLLPSADYFKFFLGILIAFLSVGLAIFTAHAFILSSRLTDMYKKLSYKYRDRDDKKEFETYVYYAHNKSKLIFSIPVLFTLVLWTISMFINSMFNFSFGLMIGKIDIDDIIHIEKHFSLYHFTVAFLGGGIVGVLAAIFWRVANLLATNPAINAIYYLTPILAVLFLFLFGTVDIKRNDFLIIGTIIIVISNLLINLSASVRLGYKTLIIALWVFGTVVYFLTGVPINPNIYFNIIFIVNTMYILVLSFRLDRFVRRTSDEENRALLLLENIDKCIRLDLLGENARQWLRKIDAPKGINDLFESYKKMKTILYKAKQNASDKESISDIEKIEKIDNQIDTLALSKQQGGNFGELVAMAILGIISIAITLFAYPKGICGVEGFAVKLFAMLLSTIVVFLFANIVDLWIDRDYPIMKEYKNTSEDEWKFGIEFRDTKSRNFERWVSSLICVAIIGIYGYFLWQEWVVVGGEIACKI